ncbi:hypothetical protein MMC26_007051 [Xylographa opegraphella]|nr:hypothetical protein [Xylographa opegraphella]
MSVPTFEKVPIVQVTDIEKSPAHSDNAQSPMSPQYQKLLEEDLIIKRRVRVLRFVSRLTSTALSAYMVGSMAFALSMYFTTRDRTISGGGHPWAPDTVLWPSYMVLAIATVTMLMNLITMCFYCCGVDAANKSSRIMGYLGYLVVAVHVVVWAVTAGLFKMANVGNDLWGFSCGPNADAIQDQVQSFLNFNNLCMIQTGTWVVTIIETISYLLLITIYIYAARRALRKRQLKKFNQQTLSQGF